MSLSSTSIKRPVLAIVMNLLLVLFGIIGFNFLSGNQKIKAISINGIMPSYQTITMLEYSLSRPLFIYVNYNHIKSTRGLKAFITELTSKQSVGKDGYLTQRGLITPTHPSRINP